MSQAIEAAEKRIKELCDFAVLAMQEVERRDVVIGEFEQAFTVMSRTLGRGDPSPTRRVNVRSAFPTAMENWSSERNILRSAYYDLVRYAEDLAKAGPGGSAVRVLRLEREVAAYRKAAEDRAAREPRSVWPCICGEASCEQCGQ